MRRQIYKMIRRAGHNDTLSRAYNLFISAVAVLSVVPLMFKEANWFLDKLDIVTVYILFLDYIFRWVTYDIRRGQPGKKRLFLLYPITPYALITFASLLPSLRLLNQGWRMLRLLRLTTVFYYSKNFVYIANVFKKEKKTLGSVLIIALGYIFISALVMFTYEPETFETFFDALYWATTALTTVGYGDVFPHTEIGQLISMISSLFGIAVIAMPAGIVTAGFVEEINREKAETKQAAEEAAEDE